MINNRVKDSNWLMIVLSLFFIGVFSYYLFDSKRDYPKEYPNIAKVINDKKMLKDNVEKISCNLYINLDCKLLIKDVYGEENMVFFDIEARKVDQLIREIFSNIHNQNGGFPSDEDMKTMSLFVDSSKINNLVIEKNDDAFSFYAEINEKEIDKNGVIKYLDSLITEIYQKGFVVGDNIVKKDNDFILLTKEEIEINKKNDENYKKLKEKNELKNKESFND